MDSTVHRNPRRHLGISSGLVCVAMAAISFQVAYSVPSFSFLIALYVWCLFELTRLSTSRQTSYLGLLTGLLVFAPQMSFLWTIFGPAAIALWLVLAFWLRMFLIAGRACRIQFGEIKAALLMPFLWTGLEYFRSELYYLRFSWLNEGYVFSNSPGWLPLNYFGMYGVGFFLMATVALLSLLSRRSQIVAVLVVLIGLGLSTQLPRHNHNAATSTATDLRVAGVQMEFPSEAEVILNLNRLIKTYPDAQLLVLSEYTFAAAIPKSINEWCKTHQRYLVIGGEAPADKGDYYDTAFVIGPSGETIFTQCKSVPIQFFKDGLPAKQQTLWNSPWGKIGFCVCYDLSYSRVTDRLIRLGAQALIVPTMDVVDWGRRQHEMHARVAPIRAAEYRVPIFRLASSGISQCVDGAGIVTSSAPMPGDAAMLSGTLRLAQPGTLPWDRFIALLSVAITGLTIISLTIIYFREKRIGLKPVNKT